MNGFRWPGRRNVVAETPQSLAERLDGLRADPRVVHTTETPSEAQEPAREAAVDAEAQAEREAAMEALRARVEAAKARPVVKPPVPAVALVDQASVDAAVERALRERDAKAEQAERQRQEAAAVGGPCFYCGITRSWSLRDGRRVGHWWGSTRRPLCSQCNAEGMGSPYAVDRERRAFVLRTHLLKDRAPTHLSRDELLDAVGFRWWGDTPGAATSTTTRFAYADVDAMLETFKPKPVVYEEGDPCKRCGVTNQWLRSKAPVNPWEPHRGTVDVLDCRGCAQAGDFLQLIASATGLHRGVVERHTDIAARAYGVTWWADSPAGGMADPPQPCDKPFGYLDFTEAKRRAFTLHPKVSSYRSSGMWELAKRAAES